MLQLGRAINIDPLIREAEVTSLNAVGLACEDLFGEVGVAKDVYSRLKVMGKRTLGRAGVVVVFGDSFMGSGGLGGDYSQLASGLGAGLAGLFEGVCSVFVEEPVMLDDKQSTNVVPALEFRVADIALEDVNLGVSQLFSRVAVPLLGQSPAVFRVSQNFIKRRNRSPRLGPQHNDN